MDEKEQKEFEKSLNYLARLLNFDEKTKIRFESLCYTYLWEPRILIKAMINYIYRRCPMEENHPFRDILEDFKMPEEEYQRLSRRVKWEPTEKKRKNKK